MKKSLLIATAFFGMILATVMPASAQQVYVQVGPVGVAVGDPYVYDYNYPVCYDQYGYAYNCSTYPYVYLNGWWGGRYFSHGYWDRRYYAQGGRYFGPGVRGYVAPRFYNGAPRYGVPRYYGGAHFNGGAHFGGNGGGHGHR
jgi:hypothetical protein